MLKIGVLGGMGPMATVDLMQKIILNTPAKTDQEHLRIIVDNNPQIPSRINAILHGAESPLPALIKSAELLRAAGADFIVIPCNTAHYWFEELQAAVKIDFIHIIDNAAWHIKNAEIDLSGRVMLLATEATVQTGIYEKSFAKYNIKLQYPPAAAQKMIADAIDEIKAGKIADNSQLKGINDWLDSLGGEIGGIIGGCTEIPLIFPYLTGSYKKYDPTELLALSAVKKAVIK